jgi:hypothetical protein
MPSTATRLLRHPAAILVLIAVEAGLAYLTGWVREPALKALATAAFVAVAAWMIVLLRAAPRRSPWARRKGRHAAR